METCANPGCTEPGTNKCAGCKTTPYCGPICQTAHWPTHKESCDGRLRKMGMDHLNKATGFSREHNWTQAHRHSDLAATKLMQLKDRPLEDISEALNLKCDALGFLDLHREQMESAKEWYCLWNTKPTDVGAIQAACALIESCIQNKEWADAHLYASTLNGIINHKHDNKIPEGQRQVYIAVGAHFLAHATLRLAIAGGIPSGEKRKAGQEAIVLARQALEIHTQLYGTETSTTANDMSVLAEALDYFDDDDEALRLFEQSISLFTQVYGSTSINVAIGEENLAEAYYKRVKKAHVARDIERSVVNLELSLPHFVKAARIYRMIGHVDKADEISSNINLVEEVLRQCSAGRAARRAARRAAEATAATTTTTTKG